MESDRRNGRSADVGEEWGHDCPEDVDLASWRAVVCKRGNEAVADRGPGVLRVTGLRGVARADDGKGTGIKVILTVEVCLNGEDDDPVFVMVRAEGFRRMVVVM